MGPFTQHKQKKTSIEHHVDNLPTDLATMALVESRRALDGDDINELRQEVSDAQAHFAAMRQEVNATCDRLQQTVERKRTELNNAIRQQEECFLSPIEDEKSFLEEHRASCLSSQSTRYSYNT
nr:hypothetical protein BaRGS_021382 [Batillaria attramentaria]